MSISTISTHPKSKTLKTQIKINHFYPLWGAYRYIYPPPCLRARSWRVVFSCRVVLPELPTETPFREVAEPLLRESLKVTTLKGCPKSSFGCFTPFPPLPFPGKEFRRKIQKLFAWTLRGQWGVQMTQPAT